MIEFFNPLKPLRKLCLSLYCFLFFCFFIALSFSFVLFLFLPPSLRVAFDTIVSKISVPCSVCDEYGEARVTRSQFSEILYVYCRNT